MQNGCFGKTKKKNLKKKTKSLKTPENVYYIRRKKKQRTTSTLNILPMRFVYLKYPKHVSISKQSGATYNQLLVTTRSSSRMKTIEIFT